jgi:hypothetical protein
VFVPDNTNLGVGAAGVVGGLLRREHTKTETGATGKRGQGKGDITNFDEGVAVTTFAELGLPAVASVEDVFAHAANEGSGSPWHRTSRVTLVWLSTWVKSRFLVPDTTHAARCQNRSHPGFSPRPGLRPANGNDIRLATLANC